MISTVCLSAHVGWFRFHLMISCSNLHCYFLGFDGYFISSGDTPFLYFLLPGHSPWSYEVPPGRYQSLYQFTPLLLGCSESLNVEGLGCLLANIPSPELFDPSPLYKCTHAAWLKDGNLYWCLHVKCTFLFRWSIYPFWSIFPRM